MFIAIFSFIAIHAHVTSLSPIFTWIQFGRITTYTIFPHDFNTVRLLDVHFKSFFGWWDTISGAFEYVFTPSLLFFRIVHLFSEKLD